MANTVKANANDARKVRNGKRAAIARSDKRAAAKEMRAHIR